MTAEALDAAVIAAVTVALDDTLFPQATWLSGAWDEVAAAGAAFGLDASELLEQLRASALTGSRDGHVIDRALIAIGVSDVELPAVTPGLVAAFKAHAPTELECYPGVAAALTRLRSMLPVACITDGDPHIQRAKLRALGLADSFDAVVFSDELGRGYRKPHPAPFERALRLLGVDAAATVHVGDRCRQDVEGAAAVGMRAIWVHSGEPAEPAELPDGTGGSAWRTFDDAASALGAVADLCRP